MTIGSEGEFRFSFRVIEKGDALSVMVFDFYQSFPYAAIMVKSGTAFTNAVRLPF